MWRSDTQAGATLVELTVAMAVIALLTAAAFPAFASAQERLALKTDADQIKFILRTMHGRALGDQTDHAVTFDLSNSTYSYFDLGEPVARVMPLSPGIRIAPPPLTTFSVKDSKVKVVFEASGWGSGGTLALTGNSGRLRRVIVNFASGRVVTR